jgi:hypothetical protein
MDQVKFKGYAQQRGFQPIQAPMGVLSRMQEQADRTLRGMRDNANALTSQRNDYEQALRGTLAREQQNRDDIYQFERQSRRNYQQARLNNLKLKAENVGEPDIQNLSALADLSKTVGNIVSDYAKQKKESDQLYGQNLVFQYGVTPNILAEYEAQKEQLTKGAAAANAAANQMEFRGVPVEVLDQVRGLGGWKLYGATRAYAIQGSQDYAIFRGSSADTPIPFGDREITLSSATSTEEWEAANAFIRTEFLKSYNGINPALLNEHLYPKMRSLEMAERVSYQEARNKVLAENRKEEDAKDLLDSVRGVDAGAGLIDWIARGSGGDPAMRSAKKREAGEILEKYASLGLIDRETLDSIRAGSYLRADGQARNIGEDFAVQLAKAYDAVYQREKRTVDEREFQESEAIKAFEKQVQDNIEAGVPLTAEALDSVLTQFENQFDREPTSFLKSLKTRTTEYVEAQALDAYLQDLDNRNLLTTRELNRYLATNPDLVAKYKTKASQNDNLATLPKDSVENAKREINARIKETLKQTGSDRVDSSAFIAASDYAERLFNEKVRYEMSVGNLSPQAAVDSAKQYIKNLIEDGKQGKGGPFAMKGQLDANGKFRPNLNQESPFEFQGRIPDNTQARKRAQNIRSRINAGTLNIETDVFLDPAELKNLERIARGQGGTFAPILASAASGRLDQNGNPRTIIDIANAQLRASGSTLQIGLSGADQIFKGLDPRWQIRLSNYPSTANTYQAFSASANYKPLLDLIASRESMGYGQYDAMNRGGSAGGTVAIGSANSIDLFGRGLSTMTVAEVMNLHSQNKVHAAGRYQIIGSTLRGLMSGSYGATGVEPTDRFDAATQDKLAIALLKGRAGRFLTGSGSLSAAVAGMGQEWIGLQNEKSKELLRTRLQQLKTTLQAPSPMRQPEMMRTNVVYHVGNIGPTSTGAHLHVGATDGGFFHRHFLDKYIRVGKAKGPLSQGVTVDGGRFGAGRDYGSHKAWDFAFDDGTPVYLSNGAQVVSNRKTQHGDELVIKLPNGRQFYFLHGTAS